MLRFFIFPVVALFLAGCADEHVAAGKKTFSRYCSPCHGTGGAGDGYNAVNLDPGPRDLTDSKEVYMSKLSNDEIYTVIHDGGIGVDLSPLMPVWGNVFSEEEIWSLVAYIRTLHPYEGKPVVFAEVKEGDNAKVKESERPKVPQISENEFNSGMSQVTLDTLDGRIAEGEEFFSDLGCIACHRIEGKGGTLGPDLTRAGFMLQPQFIYRWIRNPQGFIPKTRMPNLGLTEEEAISVTLYLSTLGRAATAPPLVVAPEPVLEAEGVSGEATGLETTTEPGTEPATEPAEKVS